MAIGAYGTEILERVESILLANFCQGCQVVDMNEANTDIAIRLLEAKPTHHTA